MVFYRKAIFIGAYFTNFSFKSDDNPNMKKDNLNKLTLSKKFTGIYTKKVLEKGVIKTKVYVSINNSRRLLGYLENISLAYAANYRQEELSRLRLGESPQLIRKKDIILFEEIAQDYFDRQLAQQVQSAKRTKARYTMHIKKTFAKVPIKDIKPQMVLEFKKCKLLEYQPATVFRLVTIINSIYFNSIHRTGKFKGTNPAYKVFTKSEFNNKRERWLNLEEIHLLLEAVMDSTSKVKVGAEAFIKISLSCGVRSGSCLALTKNSFNLKERTVELYDGKNREFYTGYLNDKLLSDEYLYNLLHGLKNDDYVLRYNDKPLLKKTLHRFTYPIYKKLFNSELTDADEKYKVCNHTLRHTFATHAVMHNDIFLVQKLLNHKDINMTLRYAKADEQKKAAAVAKMF
ncbi:MAG: hypothetical protein COA44_12965 [Arcobacter sp.]|nr:MAG: hypothetical protein COA44_12965 [Arcobacter sp.]